MMYGYPGSGKSAHLVRYFIIPQLLKREHVYTNIAGLNPFLIQEFFGHLATKDVNGNIPPIAQYLHLLQEHEIATFWRKTMVDPEDSSQSGIESTTHRALFIIDEVQNYLGTGLYKNQVDLKNELKLYVTKHRHRGDEVVFACQDPKMVDGQVVSLSEHWSHVRKANFLFGANTKTYIVNHRKGGRTGPILSQETHQYDLKACYCYNSTRQGVAEGFSASHSVRVSYLKLFWPFLFIAGLVALAGWLYWRSHHRAPVSGVTAAAFDSSGKVAHDADMWVCNGVGCDWYDGGKYVSFTDSVPVHPVGDHDFGVLHIRAIGANLDRYSPREDTAAVENTSSVQSGASSGGLVPTLPPGGSGSVH